MQQARLKSKKYTIVANELVTIESRTLRAIIADTGSLRVMYAGGTPAQATVLSEGFQLANGAMFQIDGVHHDGTVHITSTAGATFHTIT